jgi:hypothetical protein
VQTITGKSEIKTYILKVIDALGSGGIQACVSSIHKDILQKKVRFPLLEYAADLLYREIPQKDHIALTDAVVHLQTIGGNVLAGIILQKRLDTHFEESISKATEYIIAGNEWYVCDIIGERVLGYALLTAPIQTLPVLQHLSKHSDKWMVRSIGVAAHYAIKKGLTKQYVEEVFRLLLQLSNTTDFHTKKGIGWAAKTTAKFHPDIIEKYTTQIESGDVKQWFKTKINIGLSRTYKYAHRYTS